MHTLIVDITVIKHFYFTVKEDTPTQICQASRSINTRYSKLPACYDIGKVEKPTSISQFLKLYNATPNTIANELQLDLKIFQKLVLNSQKVGLQNDDMYKILVILLKLTKIGAIQILSEAFNSRSRQFCSKLQQYVMTIKSQEDFLTAIELFDAILKLLPQAWNFLPVEKLIENIDNTSPQLQLDTKCKSMTSAYQNEQKLSIVSVEENYCEYKNTSILPLTSEINNEMTPPKLRPNIVEGCYDSWEHYYDTQFKLLKEDFVASLRRGICDFRKAEQIQNTSSDNTIWKIADVRVYDNVMFTGLCFSNNGITLTIQFDCSKLRRVNWEHSKRLIYGSLLCFSCNNFETVMFASVVERTSESLKKGMITVKMESSEDILSLSLNASDYYTMIESQAHYETYYHILRSLQTAESDVMPFTNILIEASCHRVQPPAYMCLTDMSTRIKHPQPIFDMSDALGMSADQAPPSLFNVFNMSASRSSFDVSRPECWPSVDKVQLDQSQLEAIKMALTQRVSVIQGPPGTGKTYIGLKIVQALLINRDVWDPPRNSPLLVVCYTNHALDQFLEGIIDLNNSNTSHQFSIARVGGRCKSEKVGEFNIKNIEIRKVKVPKRVYRESCKIRDKVKDKGTELDYKYRVIQRKINPTPSNIEEFIAPIHLSQLFSSVNAHYGSTALRDGLEFWLSCDDLKQHETTLGAETTLNTTTSSLGEAYLNDTVPVDTYLEETPVNVDNTINVVSQAEIAEAHRMIDEPATVFHYEETGDNGLHHIRMSTPELVSSQSKQFLTIPEGPLTHSTVSLIDDIFKLSKSDRLRLFEYWKGQYIEKLCNHLRANFEGYTRECEEYKKAKQEEDFYILDTVDVIGMTTTGAAKYQHIIQRVKPKIVIVEEAAEVLESYIVSCLTAATQQLILIGDHKQLRPSPNEYYLTQEYNFDISLFERLIRADIPHATLQKQHRMRPEIAGLVCPSIYPTLDNHESVLKYINIGGVTTNLHFFNHKHPETSNGDTKSYSNVEEAKLVVGLCDYFLKQDYSPSQITVLTTYTGQLLMLKSLMPRQKFEGVRVTVVDNFQGEENDIIILSLVRSNKKGIVGFLKIENRICVALSRAKKGFYCFGNFDLLRNSCSTWESIVQYMEGIGKLQPYLVLCCSNHPDAKTTINTVDDFKHVPDGGCNRRCNTLLDCGHVCTKFCHPKDKHHQNYKCKQPCTRTCDNGHRCPSICYIDCPLCMAPMMKVMPYCGHEAMVPCSFEPQDCVCPHACENLLPCGHPCANVCGEPCSELCMVPLQRTLQCKHSITLPCSTPPDNVYCREQVPKSLLCGHETLMDCSKRVDKHKCLEKVKRQLPNCKHVVTLPCSTPVDRVSCTKTVSKQLPCGHDALLKCSEKVDEYKCQRSVEKEFANCKHRTTLPCSTSIDGVSCQKQVQKTLPCGHKTYTKCYVSVDQLKCKHKSEVTLECGHKAFEKCGKPIEKCSVLVSKVFPLCGHKKKMECSEQLPQNCTVKCTVKLMCGHQCAGNCSECYQGRMHKPCPFQMFPLPCGHHTNERCTSMKFPLCDYNCEYSCAHRNCTHPCSQSCDPCKQPCSWVCKHYKCVKQCHDICDRPKCDEPCEHKLQCRHPCIGICGEHCPRVCRICSNQKSKFKKLYVGSTPVKSNSRYIQLSCNHLFEVKELDQLLDEQFKENTIEPLMCPFCRKQIRFSHRYGNLIKRKKEMIRKLHDNMSELVSAEQRDATIDKVLKFVPTSMHAEYKASGTQLGSLLKTVTQYLPPIFAKVSSLFTHQHKYENLIIQNEADLYGYLKDMHKRFPVQSDMSTSLQELITFFEKVPPSAQKSHDVLSEALRIFLLQMITSLSSTVPHDSEDCVVVKQLAKKLRICQPRLSVSALITHLDRLQKMAEMLQIKVDKVDLKCLQPTKATNFTNGIWIICSSGHLFCRPRGLRVDQDTWQCPDC